MPGYLAATSLAVLVRRSLMTLGMPSMRTTLPL